MSQKYTLETDPDLTLNRCDIVKAIDPHTKGVWNLFLTNKKRRDMEDEGLEKINEFAYTALETLLSPGIGIFWGLRTNSRIPLEMRDGMLAYCSQPDQRYDYRKRQFVSANGDYYFVFVSEERKIFNYYWVKQSNGDMTSEDVYGSRFREKIL